MQIHTYLHVIPLHRFLHGAIFHVKQSDHISVCIDLIGEMQVEQIHWKCGNDILTSDNTDEAFLRFREVLKKKAGILPAESSDDSWPKEFEKEAEICDHQRQICDQVIMTVDQATWISNLEASSTAAAAAVTTGPWSGPHSSVGLIEAPTGCSLSPYPPTLDPLNPLDPVLAPMAPPAPALFSRRCPFPTLERYESITEGGY